MEKKPSKFPMCQEDTEYLKTEEPPCHVARKRLYEDFFPYIKRLQEEQKAMKKEKDKDRERITALEIAMKSLKRKLKLREE